MLSIVVRSGRSAWIGRVACRVLAVACFMFIALASVKAGGAEVGVEGEADGAVTKACQLFEGAWFEVCGPEEFTIVPSLPSSTGEGYDSVVFESPDGRVSFYVYSPQWGGEPSDIAIDSKTETLEAEEASPSEMGVIRWYTVAATDGSYRRSYRDITEQDGAVRTVFGIRYSDEEALQRYRDAYERFRASLQQYAD